MLRYAITSGDPTRSATALIADALRWAGDGVDFVQLREKTMQAGRFAELATAMANLFREHGGRTKLLINGRADIAAARSADGVHLTSRYGELTPAQVRQLFAVGGRAAVISIACHTLEEIRRARDAGADLILFGPIFEKRIADRVVVEGVGIGRLREACAIAAATPVLALGGVTSGTCELCSMAGAAGFASIRMFEESS